MKALVVVAAALVAGSAVANAADVAGVLASLDGPNVTERQVSPISLADLQQFSESTPWINPAIPEFYAALPAANISAPSRRMAMTMTMPDYSKESLEPPTVSVGSHYYVAGEVGAFYGTSLGHNGGSAYGGYIMGEVGNDRTQISVGSSYETSTFKVPSHFGH